MPLSEYMQEKLIIALEKIAKGDYPLETCKRIAYDALEAVKKSDK